MFNFTAFFGGREEGREEVYLLLEELKKKEKKKKTFLQHDLYQFVPTPVPRDHGGHAFVTVWLFPSFFFPL